MPAAMEKNESEGTEASLLSIDDKSTNKGRTGDPDPAVIFKGLIKM